MLYARRKRCGILAAAVMSGFCLLYFDAQTDQSTLREFTRRSSGTTTVSDQRRKSVVQAVDFRTLWSILNATSTATNPLDLPDYYLLTPSSAVLSSEDRSRFASLNTTNSGLSILVSELERNSWLDAIAGYSSNFPNPVCGVERLDGTLKMTNFSTSRVLPGIRSFHMHSCNCSCFICDVLSDTFLVRSSVMQEFFSGYVQAYESVGEALHLLFFLSMKGKGAYCPGLNMTEHVLASSQDYTCNNLGTRWDQKFVNFAKLTGYFRITNSANENAWLICRWSKQSTVAKLPIACSNFLYTYLTDITELLLNKFQTDYRIVYGTLLGALRNGDIIPWTADIDLAVNTTRLTNDNFRTAWFTHLGEYSNWLYESSITDDSLVEQDFLRAFPRCPVILRNMDTIDTSVQRLKQIKNELKDRMLETLAHSDYRRMVGYVDIYTPNLVYYNYHAQPARVCKAQVFKEPDMVQIRNRYFKGDNNARKHVERCYGKDAINLLPEEALGHFTDIIN